MTRTLWIALCLLLWGFEASSAQTPPPPGPLLDHAPFSQILQAVVTGPLVDYARLGTLRRDLDRYIATLGVTSQAALDAAPRGDQLAFWINAYNACMLKNVLDYYPIRPGLAGWIARIRNRLAGYPANSVWQIPEVFSRPHCPVARGLRSQDEIEHEIIRPRFDDPRIHFAVNCAARSCPILWPEAYSGMELDAQLDRAIRALVANPEHFSIDRGTPTILRLNKVLDWYQDDFGGLDGLRRFLADYVGDADRALLLASGTRVEFYEYDWTLNDLPR